MPAAVVSITLGAVDSVHVGGHKVVLKSASVGKGSPARSLNSVIRGHPLANMQLAIFSREFRCG